MDKNHIVSKSNALIDAAYTISLVAQRVIVLAIIEAREQGELIKAGGLLRIYATDYREHFDCKKEMSYGALKDACDSLYEADFHWHSKDDHGNEKINKSRFVQRASYSVGGGYAEIMFGNDVIPLITRLSEKYTEYDLKQIQHLKSTYSLRIFELLMKWSSVGKTAPIKLVDLRAMLGIEDEQYQNMSDFKKRVIDLAMTEITETTDYKASYDQQKKGREIVSFIFKFSKKASAKTKTDKNDKNTSEVREFTADERNEYSKKLVKNFDFKRDVLQTRDFMGLDEAGCIDRANELLAKSEFRNKWLGHLHQVGYKNT